MSATPQALYIRGPLHPDLFDGATPIMQQVKTPLAVYSVAVHWVEPHFTHIEVIACSEQEAEKLAVDQAEDVVFGDAEDFDVDDVHRIDRTPTEDEIEDYQLRQQEPTHA